MIIIILSNSFCQMTPCLGEIHQAVFVTNPTIYLKLGYMYVSIYFNRDHWYMIRNELTGTNGEGLLGKNWEGIVFSLVPGDSILPSLVAWNKSYMYVVCMYRSTSTEINDIWLEMNIQEQERKACWGKIERWLFSFFYQVILVFHHWSPETCIYICMHVCIILLQLRSLIYLNLEITYRNKRGRSAGKKLRGVGLSSTMWFQSYLIFLGQNISVQ